MNVLAIDSSGAMVAVALQYNQIINEISLNAGFKHLENSLVLTNLLLQQAGVDKKSIDLITCPKGPGSFTGLRIAIATCKGLSIALQKPLVMIDTLDAYAQSTAFMPSFVLLDARKNRFYGAFFEQGKRLGANFDLSATGILQHYAINRPTIVTGNGSSLFLEQIGPHPFLFLDPQYNASKVHFFINLAIQQFNQHGADNDADGADYLRLSDAQLLMEKMNET